MGGGGGRGGPGGPMGGGRGGPGGPGGGRGGPGGRGGGGGGRGGRGGRDRDPKARDPNRPWTEDPPHYVFPGTDLSCKKIETLVIQLTEVLITYLRNDVPESD